MSEPATLPSAKELARLVDPRDLAEFGAGWRDGVARSIANPAPMEVIEDLALLLDSAALVERINPPE